MTLLWMLRAAPAVLRHPELWAVAWRQLLVLARPGWWSRFPFLPVPDPDYLRFRLLTAYGELGAPRGEDVVTWLRWCRGER